MLLKRLDDIGVSPEDIDLLVITHFHGDHIGGMTEGASLYSHAQRCMFPNRNTPHG